MLQRGNIPQGARRNGMLLLITFSITVIGSFSSKLAQRTVLLKSARKAHELSKGLPKTGCIQQTHGTPTHHVHCPCPSPCLLICTWTRWPGVPLDSIYCPHFTDEGIIEEELFVKAACWIIPSQGSEPGSPNT